MYDKIKEDIVMALKEKDTLKLQTLRGIKGEVDLEHINKKVEINDDLDLYCIYVGKPRSNTMAGYLDFQINTTRTSFRRTISSIVSDNQFDAEATNEFLDKFFTPQATEVPIPLI